MSHPLRTMLLLSALVTAGCQAQGDTLYIGNAQVALPLVEKHWRIETPRNGKDWCVVTAGPNSVALKLTGGNKGKVVPVELRSTREISPGSSLQAQVGNIYATTPQNVFSIRDMQRLVAAMREEHGELYLSWREVGRGDRGRNSLQSRIGLEEFTQAYGQCERYLTGKPAARSKRSK